jgi:hypothetical protein
VFFRFWLTISCLFLTSLLCFTVQMLDAFYPSIVSMAPGALLLVATIFFVFAIALILLARFHFVSPSLVRIAIVLEVIATFGVAASALTFVIGFGSKLWQNIQLKTITDRMITNCTLSPQLCHSFRASLGAGKRGTAALERYVALRTATAGSVITWGLAIWLIVHGWAVVSEFDAGIQPRPKAPAPAIPPVVLENWRSGPGPRVLDFPQ